MPVLQPLMAPSTVCKRPIKASTVTGSCCMCTLTPWKTVKQGHQHVLHHVPPATPWHSLEGVQLVHNIRLCKATIAVMKGVQLACLSSCLTFPFWGVLPMHCRPFVNGAAAPQKPKAPKFKSSSVTPKKA